MKILLLGGSGLVGKEFIRQFSDHEVVAPSHAELDIENTIAVREEIAKGYDLVVNATGYNDVDGAEEDVEMALRINAEAVSNLALSCFGYSTALVHLSSLYIFGDKGDTVPCPMNNYGWTKLLGEICARTINPRTYIFRAGRLFGETGTGKKTFIDIVKDLPIDAKMVSDERCPLTYVVDLVSEIKKIVEAKKPFMTYNVVNDGCPSWLDFAKEICLLTGKEENFVAISGDELHRSARRPKNLWMASYHRHWREALKDFLIPTV